ncbi:Ku protein, partial [Rathayibacter rathayi]
MRAIDGRIRYQRKCEIDVVQFVPSEQVDPIMFDRAYILEPDSSSPKAYVLLRRTLEQTDRTAIVEFALRQKTRLAALRVRGTLLMLQTLLWANEVREVEFSSLEEGSGGEVLDLMEALRRSVERSRGPKGAGAGAGA